MFHIKNGLKEGDALLSLLFNFALEYANTKVKANHKLLKSNGTHQVVIYVDDVDIRGHSIHTISCKETGLEVNVEKAENIFLFHEQHAAQNHNT
jgi:hypothetical protein